MADVLKLVTCMDVPMHDLTVGEDSTTTVKVPQHEGKRMQEDSGRIGTYFKPT